MPPKRVKKVMTLPINVIFGHLQVRRVAFVRLCVCGVLCLQDASVRNLCPGGGC